MFMTIDRLFRKLILYGMMVLVVAGCATWQKVPFFHKSTSRPQSKSDEAKTQQYYYNQGLQHYSGENYGEAKKAFEHVIELGPNTVLGLKAQENLKKIHQILKTLEEIESK